MRLSIMTKTAKILSVLFGVSALSFVSSTYADETFTQNGQQYVLKSDVVGVIRKPVNAFAMNAKERAAAQKTKTFFDTYTAAELKAQGGAVSKKNKYRVVYRQVSNPATHTVKEVPGLLTNNIIVESQNNASLALNASFKLKKSYKENGFYLYELPAGKPVAEVLDELSKQPGVRKARVEVIEYLKMPM